MYVMVPYVYIVSFWCAYSMGPFFLEFKLYFMCYDVYIQ